MYLGKKQWNPPAREAYIEDEGDAFQVLLFEGSVQVGGCYLPDGGSGDGFDLAKQIASDWMTYNDRMKDDKRARAARH